MARLKDIAEGVKDLYMIDPAKITEEPGWNARIDGPDLDAHIRQLADSIKEIGVQEPVTVYQRGDTIILTNGHCRLMAVRLAITEGADIKSIPCRVEDRYSNDADRVLSLITRNSGKPLSPLEQSSVVKRLVAFGWTTSQIATKTGFSITHVQDLLILCGAPSAVSEMVAAGEISATSAIKTVKKHKEKATEVIKEAKKSAGEGKVTDRHLTVNWKVQGPLLRDAIIRLRDSEGDDYTTAYHAAVELAGGLTDG